MEPKIPLLLSHPLIDLIDKLCVERSDAENDCPIRLSACGDCPRKTAVLLAGGSRKPINGMQARIFSMGHDRGERFENMLVDSLEVPCERQVRVELPVRLSASEAMTIAEACSKFAPIDTPESTIRVGAGGALFVRGTMDLVLLRENRIVDFKTASDFSFNAKKEEGADPGYVAQIRAYGAAWFCAGHALPKLSLVYENKDKGTLGVADVPFTERDAEETIAAYSTKLWKIALAMRDRNFSAAPAVYTEGLGDGDALPWQCNYCSVGPVQGGCAPDGFTLTSKESRGKSKFYLAKQ